MCITINDFKLSNHYAGLLSLFLNIFLPGLGTILNATSRIRRFAPWSPLIHGILQSLLASLVFFKSQLFLISFIAWAWSVNNGIAIFKKFKEDSIEVEE